MKKRKVFILLTLIVFFNLLLAIEQISQGVIRKKNLNDYYPNIETLGNFSYFITQSDQNSGSLFLNSIDSNGTENPNFYDVFIDQISVNLIKSYILKTSTGNLCTAWIDGSYIKTKFFDENGTALSDNSILISNSPSQKTQLLLNADATGGVYFSWTEAGNAYVSYINPITGSNFQLNGLFVTNNCTRYRMIVNSSNQALLAVGKNTFTYFYLIDHFTNIVQLNYTYNTSDDLPFDLIKLNDEAFVFTKKLNSTDLYLIALSYNSTVLWSYTMDTSELYNFSEIGRFLTYESNNSAFLYLNSSPNSDNMTNIRIIKLTSEGIQNNVYSLNDSGFIYMHYGSTDSSGNLYLSYIIQDFENCYLSVLKIDNTNSQVMFNGNMILGDFSYSVIMYNKPFLNGNLFLMGSENGKGLYNIINPNNTYIYPNMVLYGLTGECRSLSSYKTNSDLNINWIDYRLARKELYHNATINSDFNHLNSSNIITEVGIVNVEPFSFNNIRNYVYSVCDSNGVVVKLTNDDLLNANLDAQTIMIIPEIDNHQLHVSVHGETIFIFLEYNNCIYIQKIVNNTCYYPFNGQLLVSENFEKSSDNLLITKTIDSFFNVYLLDDNGLIVNELSLGNQNLSNFTILKDTTNYVLFYIAETSQNYSIGAFVLEDNLILGNNQVLVENSTTCLSYEIDCVDNQFLLLFSNNNDVKVMSYYLDNNILNNNWDNPIFLSSNIYNVKGLSLLLKDGKFFVCYSQDLNTYFYKYNFSSQFLDSGFIQNHNTNVNVTSSLLTFIDEKYYYVFIENDEDNNSEIKYVKFDYTQNTGSETDQNQYLVTNLKKYPNPFNPCISFNFDLKENSYIEIDVYNVKGQKIKTLCSDFLEKGNLNFKWNGLNKNNEKQSSGVYFVTIKTHGQVITEKILLLK